MTTHNINGGCVNLLDIRSSFIELSGRYDLVAYPDFVDTGANFFIQTGQKLLDRLTRTSTNQGNQAVSFFEVSKGETIVQIPQVFNVSQVEWTDGNQTFVLERLLKGSIFQFWHNSGVPNTYEILSSYYKPDVNELSSTFQHLPTHLFQVSHQAFHTTSIRLHPKPFEKGFIGVRGAYYSTPLVVDTDISVWSERFPDLLIQASLWALETAYRNTEGANDFLRVITMQIGEEDMHELEWQIRDINQMNG